MRTLSDPALRRLRSRLGPESAALPFAEAVALQLAHPPGASGGPAAERDAVERAAAVLARAAAGPAADPGAAGWLRSDPPLLAAVFQNVDLLYQGGYPGADAVSALVMRALEEAQPPA